MGDALADYHFGEYHPFGPGRYRAFVQEFERRGLARRVQLGEPSRADPAVIELFHDPEYVRFVREASAAGEGFLDHGDTPVVSGIFEAAATVVGTVVAAADALMAGECGQALVPIAGLHHARRDRAGGFCVFNDPGIAIEHLRARHGVRRIAYVDLDAHHADGVFYGFEEDPDLFMADFHEDGHFLYPGTGLTTETGKGLAEGTKLNIPLAPGAGDAAVFEAWPQVEALLERASPEIILFQCGADSLGGDPLTDLALTASAHGWVTGRLKAIAQRHAGGRVLAMGGGGYNAGNLAAAWCEVVIAFLGDEPS